MASQWYAVKTFYRSKTEGRPRHPDRFCDTEATLVEERIVLFKAKTKAEATKKAEKEARQYATKNAYTNPYDQKVTTRYLELYDIYSIDGALSDKDEIFCASRVMNKKVSNKKIAHVYLNKPKKDVLHSRRKVFMNKDLVDP